MTQATRIVHWPGRDVPACDGHAQKLFALGVSMGMLVNTTPCFELKACTNCENEERKAKAAAG